MFMEVYVCRYCEVPVSDGNSRFALSPNPSPSGRGAKG